METKHIFVILIAYSAYKWIYPMMRDPETVLRNDVDDMYDFVIVGAGAAGSVMANRLSENPKWKILILEAGEDDSKYPAVPIATPSLWGNPDIDWMYLTTPQKHACKSSHNKQCAWSRGRVLGGSSSTNCMVYSRGYPADFDYWANDLGCEGWSYEDVLPYFKKAESNKNPDYVRSGYHGDSGPLVVSDSNGTILGDTFLQAGAELGFTVGDSHAKEHDGVFSHIQSTTNKGSRWSTASAYLRPAMGRSNLHVVINAHVTKVLFDGTRAVGAAYMRNGRISTVRARKEVIMSAGLIGTAHILMLSGVGPKWHLEDLGIPVLADLPVGENVRDQLMSLEPQFRFPEPIAINPETVESIWELVRHTVWGDGHLASPCGAAASVYTSVPSQPAHHPFPYIQIIMIQTLFGSSVQNGRGFAKAMNIKTDAFDSCYGDVENQHGMHLVTNLLHMRSKGTIRLSSQNPFDYPLIDPDYLSKQEDIKIFIDGLRYAQRIAQTDAFKKLGAEVIKHHHPSCSGVAYDTDAYWECYLRHMATPYYHTTGSCRMGPANDGNSVVDLSLKVKGLQSLRVVDASVLPEVPSGNTAAPTIMVAEKAADIVKAEHK